MPPISAVGLGALIESIVDDHQLIACQNDVAELRKNRGDQNDLLGSVID